MMAGPEVEPCIASKESWNNYKVNDWLSTSEMERSGGTKQKTK